MSPEGPLSPDPQHDGGPPGPQLPLVAAVLATAVVVLVLGLVGQALVPLSLPLLRALALTLGLAIAVVGALRGPRPWQVAVALVAWAAMWFCVAPAQLLLCLALLLAALVSAGVLWSFAITLAALDIAYHVSSQTAGFLERITGPLHLGWYASGLPVLLACLSAMVVPPARRSLVGALALVAAWVLYLALRGWLPLGDLSHMCWWQAGWAAAAGTALALTIRPSGRPLGAGALSLSAALLAAVTLLLASPPAGISSPLRVGIWHGEQVGTWDAPDWDHLGLELNTAHFGALTAYLHTLGWTTRDIGPEVSPSDLSGLDIVLVVTPRRLSDATIAALHSFVRDGGGLLVAGDHTAMFGIREPINRLLAPSGIVLNDDTALHLREGWQGSLDLIGDAWRFADQPPQFMAYGVGASLTVPPTADVLAIGQACLADGPAAKPKDAGRLGNYAFDRGERLGGLPLIALARVGRGRIMAWGDTSPLQTLALRTSLPFCRRMIALAAGVKHWYATPISQSLTGPIAVVDAGHANAFDLRGVSGDSIDGLFLGLLRAGYVPFVESGEAFTSLLPKAHLAAVIAPHAPFTPPEVAAVRDMLERGGTLILACGWQERPAALPLLNLVGLDVDSVPLGPVPYLDETPPGPWQRQPRFCDAWPLNLPTTTSAVPLYGIDLGGHRRILIAEAHVGRGRAIVVADPAFFTDRNLEGRSEVWSPNADLVRSMLDGGSR